MEKSKTSQTSASPTVDFIWDTERVVHSGDGYFHEMVEDFRAAFFTIDIEVYIFDPDDVGKIIVRELISAAARGVRVRVLVDGFGALAWMTTYAPLLELNGVETRVFHPLRFFWNLNQRNHRKCCMIDSKIAWVGSFNISATHSEKIYGNRAWRDCAARVSGQGVIVLEQLFRSLWVRSKSPFSNPVWRAHQWLVWKRTLSGFIRNRHGRRIVPWKRRRRWRRMLLKFPLPAVRSNPTSKAGRKMALDFARRIATAKQRVWIANAYFVPTRMIRNALTRACDRGVDVRVMVPKSPDIFFIRWVSAALTASLAKCGVRIFEYGPSVLHAKYALIDDWVTVGSTNLNHRSFLFDYELDVVLSSPESRKSIEEHFLIDSHRSRELDRNFCEQVPWIERLLGRFLLRLRKWM